LTVLLQSLGVANLAEAESRERPHAQRVAEGKAATSVLAAHAPNGLAVLEADVAALSTKLIAAKQTLETLALAVGLRPPAFSYRKRNRTNLRQGRSWTMRRPS
jgi:hypothetical protein